MPAPALLLQTAYAELVERCASAAFNTSFSTEGAFTPKAIKGRRYWYFQSTSKQGHIQRRVQRYVGPETPELLERIARHKEARDDERERRALVSNLIRSFGMPRPDPKLGNVVEALAKAGVFRLRGVLVGTVAYQIYPAMLGTTLPGAALRTEDVDIAQFKNISVAVEDHTPPALDILQGVDKTFRAIPHLHGHGRVTTYEAKGGLRVDFLTPNEGPDTDEPERLPTFGTDAQPLRFLDFLIHDSEVAVMLHNAGVYVNVPSPQRYAVHKLIIAQRRREGVVKRDKDIQQAETLLRVLQEKRPHELEVAWNEAYGRGPAWRELLAQGMQYLTPRTRDLTLKTAGKRRSIIPNVDLTFDNPRLRYVGDRDVITFPGATPGGKVHCEISREALDDHFGTDGMDEKARIDRAFRSRSSIENMARIKYLEWPIEEPEAVLIRTDDVEKLSRKIEPSKTHV